VGPLETNKGKIDAVDEPCYIELENWVAVLIKPLLERAREQELQTNVGELQSRLTDRLQMVMQQLKGKRAKNEERGTSRITPTREGGQHKRLRNTQPGERKIRPPSATFRVFFVPMGDQEQLARVDLPKGSVSLNSDHPGIKEAIASVPRNDDALLNPAFASLAHEWVDNSTDRFGQHQIFPHWEGSDVGFDEVLAWLLNANLQAAVAVAS